MCEYQCNATFFLVTFKCPGFCGRDISYGRERSTVHSCSVPLEEDSLCELGRGSAVLLKLSGFTLCHFEENRSTSASIKRSSHDLNCWIKPLRNCEYTLTFACIHVCVFKKRAAIVWVTLEKRRKICFGPLSPTRVLTVVIVSEWRMRNVCKVELDKSKADWQLYSGL